MSILYGIYDSIHAGLTSAYTSINSTYEKYATERSAELLIFASTVVLLIILIIAPICGAGDHISAKTTLAWAGFVFFIHTCAIYRKGKLMTWAQSKLGRSI